MQNTTAEIVRELLAYKPETGKLIWKNRDRKWFSSDRDCKWWNDRFAGKAAFTSKDSHGYQCGRIFNRRYLAHRIIWLMQTGNWPKNTIDHVNHDPADNRWKNLRGTTHRENMKNKSLAKNNVSGVVGVHWHKRARRWRAEIQVGSSRRYLGSFENKSDAVAARKAAEREHGYHANHGRAR